MYALAYFLTLVETYTFQLLAALPLYHRGLKTEEIEVYFNFQCQETISALLFSSGQVQT